MFSSLLEIQCLFMNIEYVPFIDLWPMLFLISLLGFLGKQPRMVHIGYAKDYSICSGHNSQSKNYNHAQK